MKRVKGLALGALAATAAVTIAACGSGGGSGSPSSSTSASKTSYGEGITQVVNPSSSTSNGTLTFDLSNQPDSTDYQNTYYAFMWDFVRLYSMPLLTYKSCPGKCGLQLVPSLATGPGVVSDHGLTWTYHIQPNVKFENGVTVTAQDVKYGIERTYAKSVLPNGPNYYQVLLKDPTYPGPYTDRSKNLMGLTSVTTPNATTIQFHLAAPFSDFDYVVALPQSTPVLPSWDSGKYGGANFQLHPISTGPYKFQSYTLNKQLTLVKNTDWNPSTDPQAKQLVSKIVLNMNVAPNTVDSNLLANYADIDLAGTGVQTAARAKILSSPALKADSDDPINGFLRFFYLNLKLIPNLHCREAIEYAANKTSMQTAYGGPIVGGDIASTIMPPNIIGYKKFDLYDALSQPNGDDSAAKAQLKLCGKPSGFSTGIAYRTDRPQDALAAQALQASLNQVGIKTTLDGYLSGKYYTNFAGDPSYVHSHNLGIDVGGWGADWPDGYGFLDELSNGNSIAEGGGNTNVSEINNPSINSLFAQAANDTNATTKNAIWTQIDQKIMGEAAILPVVYQKVLLYRNPNVTNAYVDSYYGMYNYAVLGLK
jgi:peptide/nickel transport system substrate-binding protein